MTKKIFFLSAIFSFVSGMALAQFISLPVWHKGLGYTFLGEWTWVQGTKYIGPYNNHVGTQGTASYVNWPGTRTVRGASWTDSSGNLWTFGGKGRDLYWTLGLMSDLWKYEPTGCSGKGCWTWMKGSEFADQAGTYGTKGTEAAGNLPGGRQVATSVWYDGTYLWMFGGYGYDGSGSLGQLNDLWRYNPSNNRWTWISGGNVISQNGVYGTQGTGSTSNYPGAREGAAAWYSPGYLWLFGGYGRDGSGGLEQLSDLWRYEISTGQWTWMKGPNSISNTGTYGTQGTEAAGNLPGARSNSGFWKDSSGNFWLFAGYGLGASGGGGLLNDMWRYNVSNNRWTWMKGSSTIGQNPVHGTKGSSAAGNNPAGGEFVTYWTDGSGNFWLFGGEALDSAGNFGYSNNLWKFDPTTNNWTWISGSSTRNALGVYGDEDVPHANNTPGARGGGTSHFVTGGNKLWLFGGRGYDCCDTTAVDYMQDMWSFSTSTGQWTYERGLSDSAWSHQGTVGVENASNYPPPRSLQSCSVDSTNRYAWVFAGTDQSNMRTDLWRFNIANERWTRISGSTSNNIAGVYGTKGTANVANYPGSRRGAVQWNDSSGRTWVLGGWGYDSAGNVGFLNDLWRYDPAGCAGAGCWTWMTGTNTRNNSGTWGTMGTGSTSNTPSARQNASAVVDAAGDVWVAGGEGRDSGGNTGYMNDLWRYRPSNGEWTWVAGAQTRNEVGEYFTQGTPHPSNTIGGRALARLWIDKSGYMYIFGGFGYDDAGNLEKLNDLWRFNFSNGEITWMGGSQYVLDGGTYGTQGVEAASNIPSARYGAVGFLDSSNNYWIFGGLGTNGYYADTWRYNTTNNRWTWMGGNSSGVWNPAESNAVWGPKGTASVNYKINPRAYHCGWKDSSTENFYIFGGEGWDGGDHSIFPLNDLWKTH